MTRFNLVNGDYITFDEIGDDSYVLRAINDVGNPFKTCIISGNKPIGGEPIFTVGMRTAVIRDNTAVIVYMNEVTSIEHDGIRALS